MIMYEISQIYSMIINYSHIGYILLPSLVTFFEIQFNDSYNNSSILFWIFDINWDHKS